MRQLPARVSRRNGGKWR